MTTDPKTTILSFLNDIAPDTFSEGDFANWTFRSMSRDGDSWRIGFRNTGAEDGDVLSFTFAGEALDTTGSVRREWLDTLQQAVFRWEGEMRGEGDE